MAAVAHSKTAIYRAGSLTNRLADFIVNHVNAPIFIYAKQPRKHDFGGNPWSGKPNVTHRSWKYLFETAQTTCHKAPVRHAATSFADNPVGFIARHFCLLEAGASLLDLIHHGA